MVQVLASTKTAKIAAAALTAATVIGGTFAASAQQMSLGAKPDFSACDRLSSSNPLAASQCRVDAIEAHTRQMRRETAANLQRIQVAEINTDCAREVGELRAANPAATAIARELVKASGRPAAEYGICRLRDGIRAGLAAQR